MKALRHAIVAGVLAAAWYGVAPAQTVDISRYELFDLTHPFNAQTIFWPTSPSSFALERLSFGETPGGWFYSANRLCTPEHGGTHLDAPIHFDEKGQTADAVPLERLIAPGVVIDVSESAAKDADYRMTRDDVPGFENLRGLASLPATGALVIALPMKIEGGSGGPLRAVELVPKGK